MTDYSKFTEMKVLHFHKQKIGQYWVYYFKSVEHFKQESELYNSTVKREPKYKEIYRGTPYDLPDKVAWIDPLRPELVKDWKKYFFVVIFEHE